MNKIQIFKNPEFGEMRTIMINGEPWFVGKYIASVLGYARPDNTVTERTEKDDRIYIDGKTHPEIKDKIDYKELGQRGGWLINESGVYSLIFGSKLESAKKFQKWVTSEVLPSIRKTGSYGKQNTPPLTLKEQVQTIAQATTELYEQVDKVAASIHDVKSEIETIKNDLPLLPIGADKIKNAVNKRVVSLLGGKQSNAYKDESLRAKVFINCHRNLKSNFEGIHSYKEIRQKDTEKAVKIINEYTPPLSLAEQIKMANAQQSFNFEEDEINSRYYNIGLLIGALRAELEKGTVSLESAYGLLTDGVKAAIDSELIHKGGTVK